MNILQKIIEYKKTIIIKQKQEVHNISQMQDNCYKMPPVTSFINALEKRKADNKISLIAEVKKASPSKGLIREDFNPVYIAQAYEKAGASAISVLTDEKFFQGSIEYLKNIKKTVKLPILRKDFIIDPFQIYQTRAMGADLMLLIASALEKNQLQDYLKLAKDLGLEVLIEVHSKDEFDFVLETGARLVGINNRNLETFEVSLDNTINLIKGGDFPDRFIISESGINDYSEVLKLKDCGVSGILVGESLMKQDNIEKAVINLIKGQC